MFRTRIESVCIGALVAAGIGIGGGPANSTVDAFQPQVVSSCLRSRAGHIAASSLLESSTTNCIEIDEMAERNIAAFQEWAANCGVQMAEGVQLMTDDGGMDYSLMTTQDLPSGSPVLYVPGEMILSSDAADLPSTDEAERQLGGNDVALFRLFVRILAEYEKGLESLYFPWMDALPRRYYGGASMTYACFDTLPPFVGLLAKKERSTFKSFHKVLHYVPELSGITLTDRHLVKWSYNVVNTRSFDMDNGETRSIVPFADMFNHHGDPNVEISYDDDGNCIAYATRDISAGSHLRISYGDSTNPSPLFAKYGFLDDSSPGSFCKILNLQSEMRDLGMDFRDLLFYKNGDIADEVYDLMLYSILAFDPNLQQGFYDAYMSGDDETKRAYHNEYFPYTVEALQKHVDGLLDVLDRLSIRALEYDPQKHPRIPVILEHNTFVKNTFTLVKANLDTMAMQFESATTDAEAER